MAADGQLNETRSTPVLDPTLITIGAGAGAVAIEEWGIQLLTNLWGSGFLNSEDQLSLQQEIWGVPARVSTFAWLDRLVRGDENDGAVWAVGVVRIWKLAACVRVHVEDTNLGGLRLAMSRAS